MVISFGFSWFIDFKKPAEPQSQAGQPLSEEEIMALIRLDHVPETVKVNLPLYIILPDPGRWAGCLSANARCCTCCTA